MVDPIAATRSALHGRSDVDLAIVFGSAARNAMTEDSDVDVAVHAREGDRLALIRDLSLALGREVDVVDLDAVGYPLLASIVRDGVVVAERRRGDAARWRTRALLRLEDERPTFVRMREGSWRRSRPGMRMVDRDAIADKLGELRDRVGRVRSHCAANAEALAADRDALDLVSFNLMLAVRACIDVASHIIADEGWRPATTLAASFQRLTEHGVIAPATSRPTASAVGLRNVVAHGYAGVNPALVHAAATNGLCDLEAFSSEVVAWLGPAA